jgi:hypothetical protein
MVRRFNFMPVSLVEGMVSLSHENKRIEAGKLRHTLDQALAS